MSYYDPIEVVGYDAGAFITYTGANDAQVNWGSHDDPRGLLVEGQQYEVSEVDVHSSYTAVYLVGYGSKHFNSVCFEFESDEDEDIDGSDVEYEI